MTSQIDLVIIKKRLKQQQKVLNTQINEERKKSSPLSIINPDRADLARDYAYRERHLKLLEQLEDQLFETKQALQRIKEGTYGICERCSKPIQPERLEALPSASLCIDCQTLKENM